jgi:hypothetical protein
MHEQKDREYKQMIADLETQLNKTSKKKENSEDAGEQAA